MTRIIALLIILVAYGSQAYAVAIPFELVKDKSYVKFIAMVNGAPVGGNFTDFDATILFDYDYPDKSSIKVEVKTSSLKTDYQEVADNVGKKEWLASEEFPTAHFETTHLTKVPSTWNYYGEGKLTLRGKAVPVAINFQIEDFDDRAIADGYLTVKRNTFGVGQGQWAKDDVVKDQVRVEFRITALKNKAKN